MEKPSNFASDLHFPAALCFVHVGQFSIFRYSSDNAFHFFYNIWGRRRKFNEINRKKKVVIQILSKRAFFGLVTMQWGAETV